MWYLFPGSDYYSFLFVIVRQVQWIPRNTFRPYVFFINCLDNFYNCFDVFCFKISLYTYNWSVDKLNKLMERSNKLVDWYNLRACFLSSVVYQKLGLFLNQPAIRKSNNCKLHSQEQRMVSQYIFCYFYSWNGVCFLGPVCFIFCKLGGISCVQMCVIWFGIVNCVGRDNASPRCSCSKHTYFTTTASKSSCS